MAFIISTCLKNNLMSDGDYKTEMDGGVIDIYGSPTSYAAALALVPATADASIGSATLLCTISNNGDGTGINFDTAPVDGLLGKAPGETWVGDYVASGYPSFYRHRSLSDTGAEDTTKVLNRAQGSVGILGTDFIISAQYKNSGDEQRADSYVVGIP